MATARLIWLLATFLALGACRPETVDLAYRFEQGDELRYRLAATASADWNIGGQRGQGSYEISFDVTESVASVEEDAVLVSVVLDATAVEENGLPSPGLGRTSFTLDLAPTGGVTEVLEVDGVPARAVDPDQLALVGSYRPPLPDRPVRLRDEWRSTQELNLANVRRTVTSDGTVEALGRDVGGSVAHLRYEAEGPLLWTTQLPQGAAQLAGVASSSGTAVLDIDHGFLREASSSTEARFDVTVKPVSGEAPIAGMLDLRLDLELEWLP